MLNMNLFQFGISGDCESFKCLSHQQVNDAPRTIPDSIFEEIWNTVFLTIESYFWKSYYSENI